MGHKLDIKSDDFVFCNSEILLDGRPLHCSAIKIEASFDDDDNSFKNGPVWNVTVRFPCVKLNVDGKVLGPGMKESIEERADYFTKILDECKFEDDNIDYKDVEKLKLERFKIAIVPHYCAKCNSHMNYSFIGDTLDYNLECSECGSSEIKRNPGVVALEKRVFGLLDEDVDKQVQ